MAGAAGLLCKKSTACSVAWASSSGGVSLAHILVPGARKGCWPVTVPMLALPSPGVVWQEDMGSAGASVPSSRGLRLRTVGQGGERGGWRKDGSEPRDSGHTACCRMSCWEKILMINVFRGEKK